MNLMHSLATVLCALLPWQFLYVGFLAGNNFAVKKVNVVWRYYAQLTRFTCNQNKSQQFNLIVFWLCLSFCVALSFETIQISFLVTLLFCQELTIQTIVLLSITWAFKLHIQKDVESKAVFTALLKIHLPTYSEHLPHYYTVGPSVKHKYWHDSAHFST